MNDVSLAPLAVSPRLLAPAPAAVAAGELARRGQIRETAQSFEATFLASMLGEMFEGVEPAAPFGGGPGEAMFKSFLTDAMARQMTKGGGVGLAASIEREMLKLQGLK